MTISGMKAEIQGIDELRKAMEKAGERVGARLADALMAGGAVIRDEAARLAEEPVASFGVHLTDKTAQDAQVAIGPVKDKWHLTFREYGASQHAIKPRKARGKKTLRFANGQIRPMVLKHPGVPERPFLRPAFDTKNAAAVEEIRSHLAAVLTEGLND